MKFASAIAILAFVALPGLRATPIDLTATSISFDCGGRGPCGSYSVSGPGFEASMLGIVTASPGSVMELDLDGFPFYDDFGSTLMVGNTTYEVSAIGPTVIAYMTSTTDVHDEWSASGPATATGEISVCSASVELSGGTCDPALAFAVINLPGLRGTFSQSWHDVTGFPGSEVFNYRGGSLSATPEPLSAGFAFAGLLFLAAYRRWRLKAAPTH